MSYDPACETLAEYFLGSMAPDRLKRALAQHIQDDVESWIEFRLAEVLREIERQKQ